MKKVFETIKDILYDSIDYVIMLVILVVVVAVIGWRLDVLFAKDAFDVPGKNEVIVDNSGREPKTSEDIHKPTGNENPGEDNVVPEPDVKTTEIVEPTTEEPPKNPAPINSGSKVVKVNIPAGSLPSKIGSILESNGLVYSSKDFITKAVELKLDTKLKSGSYDIASGSTIEQILKVITK